MPITKVDLANEVQGILPATLLPTSLVTLHIFTKGHAETVSSSSAPVSSGTIAISSPVMLLAPASSITGMILAVGTVDGQVQTLINNSANTITFAAVATSHVADGTSDVIAANNARTYRWSTAASKWFPQK